MANGATIDPSALHVIFGGHRVSGYMPGTFVSVIYDVDAFTKLIGVDGEGAWFKNANLAALVTLTLMQSSQSNDVLSAALTLDRAAPGGILTPMSVAEVNGTSHFVTEKARVMKLPDSVWADTVQGRAWVIGTTRLNGIVGGVFASQAP